MTPIIFVTADAGGFPTTSLALLPAHSPGWPHPTQQKEPAACGRLDNFVSCA
jgi:hypothetical protein